MCHYLLVKKSARTLIEKNHVKLLTLLYLFSYDFCSVAAHMGALIYSRLRWFTVFLQPRVTNDTHKSMILYYLR